MSEKLQKLFSGGSHGLPDGLDFLTFSPRDFPERDLGGDHQHPALLCLGEMGESFLDVGVALVFIGEHVLREIGRGECQTFVGDGIQ